VDNGIYAARALKGNVSKSDIYLYGDAGCAEVTVGLNEDIGQEFLQYYPPGLISWAGNIRNSTYTYCGLIFLFRDKGSL